MKIIIAPDSFKESLDAASVSSAIAKGIRKVLPHADIIERPMADGGEGTLDALMRGTSGQTRSAHVLDALGRPCTANWGWIEPDTAFIEMASAAGLEQICPHKRAVMQSDTTGVGMLICKALDQGARTIVLTAGGSATNDCGAGMLKALGLGLRDASGDELSGAPHDLARLASLDTSSLDSRIPTVRWIVATDVDNPLCGERGASSIFGPQKGATPEQVRNLDETLAHFADLTSEIKGEDKREVPGAGAGGGIGYGAIAWLGATVRPGAELVAELVQLDHLIAGADLVITGEGRLDGQTLYGKAPMQVIRTAYRHGVPVIGIAGSLGTGYEAMYEHGLGAAFSLAPGPMSLQQACSDAANLLQNRTRDIMRTMLLGARVGPDRWPTE